MGWPTVFQVEKKPHLLDWGRYNFPEAHHYSDIESFNGKQYEGEIDIICGGFPCQPFSISGKRRGRDDARSLWPEMLRVIDEIRPYWVVAENVPGIISLELDNVLSDLESKNYSCWPPLSIPACATGADHRRERVFIVAHSNSERRKKLLCNKQRICSEKSWSPNARDSYIITADQFEQRLSKPLLLPSPDGLPVRMDTIRIFEAAGNAIVPQIAYRIFQAIDIATKSS